MRTTIDFPDDVYRRLCTQAARENISTNALILRAVEHMLENEAPPLGKRVRLPLLKSKKGRIVGLDNARIYDLISFP